MTAETKHTPSPWMVAGKEYGWDHFAAIITPTGIVANCHIAALSRTHDQTAADARLIAAAPDLLAACEALLASHRPGLGQCCKASDLGIAAIAKATGGHHP